MGPIEKKMEGMEHEQLLADPNVVDALNDILTELSRAERLHPIWPADPVYAVSIMMEEAGEAVQAANDIAHSARAKSNEELRKELIQTGAMTIRCLMHLEV